MNQGTSQDIATFRRSRRIAAHSWRASRANGPSPLRHRISALSPVDLARRWTTEGHLVATEVVSSVQDEALVLEHPRVFFPSYPWEWTPGQWVAAAELTLEFCRQLLHQGWILKDATPLNILFDGSRPVFVDLLSVERRDPGNPLWLAYGQFARTFLLPLAAYKYLGWPRAATLQSPRRLRAGRPLPLSFRFPALERSAAYPGHTPFPARDPQAGIWAAAKLKQAPEIATAVLERNLRRPKKALRALAVKERDSRWSEYQTAADPLSELERQRKQEFVDRAMQMLRPGSVLDIGGNTGQYSRIAASAGRTCGRLGYRCCLFGSQLEGGPEG